MGSLARRALQILAAPRVHVQALNGFIESLIQKFEDCRPGLSDEDVRHGGERVERYFLDLYDKERIRLDQAIRLQEPYLSPEDSAQFRREVDDLVRRVVVPAYVRLATGFTPRERNYFYLTPEGSHGLERIGWCVLGMLVGAFVVWAPFIPLWSKEWVLPFALAGLFFPNLRAVFAFRHYEAELGRLVERADHEIERVDIAYLTRRRERGEIGASTTSGSAGEPEADDDQRPGVRKAKEGTH
jgi:hypothetical protein